MLTTQRTNVIQEAFLELATEAFLIARKSENVATGTLSFYQDKLPAFANFREAQEVKYVGKISSSLIRSFLWMLEAEKHNPGGVHPHFRTTKAFLRWYERQFEPSGWHNPVAKLKAPKVPESN